MAYSDKSKLLHEPLLDSTSSDLLSGSPHQRRTPRQTQASARRLIESPSLNALSPKEKVRTHKNCCYRISAAIFKELELFCAYALGLMPVNHFMLKTLLGERGHRAPLGQALIWGATILGYATNDIYGRYLLARGSYEQPEWAKRSGTTREKLISYSTKTLDRVNTGMYTAVNAFITYTSTQDVPSCFGELWGKLMWLAESKPGQRGTIGVGAAGAALGLRLTWKQNTHGVTSLLEKTRFIIQELIPALSKEIKKGNYRPLLELTRTALYTALMVYSGYDYFKLQTKEPAYLYAPEKPFSPHYNDLASQFMNCALPSMLITGFHYGCEPKTSDGNIRYSPPDIFDREITKQLVNTKGKCRDISLKAFAVVLGLLPWLTLIICSLDISQATFKEVVAKVWKALYEHIWSMPFTSFPLMQAVHGLIGAWMAGVLAAANSPDQGKSPLSDIEELPDEQPPFPVTVSIPDITQ